MYFKNIILGFLFCASISLSAQDIVNTYIENFQYIAVSEMERTGIPASIKLAQGLLESDWGRSELSQFAHNHFGIKCGGSWQGKTYYKVDDDYGDNGELKESCFRIYSEDNESFIAHSEFLLSNPRYEFLFDYSSTDYTAWAKGLKKAGYATDPSYPSKIIGVITKYDLSRFDYMAPDEMQILAKVEPKEKEQDSPKIEKQNTKDYASNEPKVKKEKSSVIEEATASIDEGIKDFTKNFQKHSKAWNSSPKAAVENNQKEDVSEKSDKKAFNFDNLLAEIESIGNKILNKEEANEEAITSFPDLNKFNGVEMTLSESNETLTDVAIRKGVNVKELVVFNDQLYGIDKKLPNGTTVYLEPKKEAFEGSRKIHQVVASESVANISQRYGVTEASIRKRNQLDKNDEVKHGELLYLRGARRLKKPALAPAKKNKKEYLFVSESDK